VPLSRKVAGFRFKNPAGMTNRGFLTFSWLQGVPKVHEVLLRKDLAGAARRLAHLRVFSWFRVSHRGMRDCGERISIMKLSFSTNAFVRFSVPEAVEIIAKTGYAGVEILADVPHLYPFSTTGQGLAEIASCLEKNRIRAANINANTALGYYGAKFWEPLFEPSLANPEADARKWRVEYTKKCIDMARLFSCRNVSVTSGRMVPGTRPERSLALLKESLLDVVEYAAAKNVRVGMEYEPGLLVERVEELASLIREIGADNFGANLDFGHSHVAGEDPHYVARMLGSGIFHVHVEDICKRKHYHLIPGQGEIDFTEIFRALDGIGYDEFVTVELYTFPEIPREAAEEAFNYLENIFSNGTVK